MQNSPPVLHENVPEVSLTTAIVTGNYGAVYSMQVVSQLSWYLSFYRKHCKGFTSPIN